MVQQLCINRFFSECFPFNSIDSLKILIGWKIDFGETKTKNQSKIYKQSISESWEIATNSTFIVPLFMFTLSIFTLNFMFLMKGKRQLYH